MLIQLVNEVVPTLLASCKIFHVPFETEREKINFRK